MGRIRIGQRSAKGYPQKLDRFRFTSHSQHLIEKIASLYGGEVEPWTPKPGAPQQWQVVSESTRIPILVPPQPVTQWLELWSGGGCVHRCDGVTEVISGEPCDLGPEHEAARPTTRLNVVLKDVEGIGVFRLESHGWNAATELPHVAEFLAQAGAYIDGWLGLEERVSISNGETKRFVVPIIDIDITPAQLLAQHGRPVQQLEGSQRPALEAPQGVPDYVGMAQQCETLQQVQQIWHQADAAGHLSDELKAKLFQIGQRLNPGGVGSAPMPQQQDASDLNPDALWREIMEVAGGLGMTLADVEQDFPKVTGGVLPQDAGGREMQIYLNYLRQEPQA